MLPVLDIEVPGNFYFVFLHQRNPLWLIANYIGHTFTVYVCDTGNMSEKLTYFTQFFHFMLYLYVTAMNFFTHRQAD
jgi:hypothetical protein